MDIRQLRFLIALAHERHFARAAAEIGITQPTLSARIKQLEEEFGVAIIERGNRFKGFTPEGERVLAWARRILADCDSLTQELSGLKGELAGQLTIGAIPSALSATAMVTKPFRDRHPQVRLVFLSMNSRQIVAALESFDIHAGLTYLDNEALGTLARQALYQERYMLVSADVDASPEVTWKEAARQPLCLMTEDMQFRRIVDRAFKAAGASAVPAIETNAISAMVGHVLAGGVAAVLSDHQVRLLDPQGRLHARRLVEPEICHQVGLVSLPREPMPVLLNALLDAV